MLPYIMWNTPNVVEDAISIGHILVGILVHHSVHHKSSQALHNAYKSMCYTCIGYGEWCPLRESNPQLIITNDPLYHLTKRAVAALIARLPGQSNLPHLSADQASAGGGMAAGCPLVSTSGLKPSGRRQSSVAKPAQLSQCACQLS